MRGMRAFQPPPHILEKYFKSRPDIKLLFFVINRLRFGKFCLEKYLSPAPSPPKKYLNTLWPRRQRCGEQPYNRMLLIVFGKKQNYISTSINCNNNNIKKPPEVRRVKVSRPLIVSTGICVDKFSNCF